MPLMTRIIKMHVKNTKGGSYTTSNTKGWLELREN